MGTAGAIRNAEKYIQNESFLVMHSDVLIDIDLSDLLDFHNEEKYLSTIALVTVPDPKKYGMVKVKGINLIDFLEKPPIKKDSNLISAGVYILEPQVLKLIAQHNFKSMEKEVFPLLAKEGKMSAYLNAGQWFDLSHTDAYQKAKKSFKYRVVS